MSARRWWATARWPTVARHASLDADVIWWRVEEHGAALTIPLRLHGGTTQEDVANRSDVIRALYGAARVEVLPVAEHGGYSVVVLHASASPTATPYPATRPTLVPPRVTQPLPLGVDDWGTCVSVPLFDHTGATSLLIGGVPGSGKTTAVRALLAGLARTSATIVVIDPTGGAEASLWRERLASSVLSAEATPTIQLLNELLAIIKRRGPILAAGAAPSELPAICVVCDELAELAAAGTARQQEDARTLLRRVVALGRKANVACILATQRTTSTSIDITTRSLTGWRLALAHPSDRHGSEALLGPGRYEASDLRKSDRGVGYLTDGGPPRLLRVFAIGPDDARTVSQSKAWNSFAELARWDQVALDERL